MQFTLYSVTIHNHAIMLAHPRPSTRRRLLLFVFLLPVSFVFGQIGPSIKPKDGRYDICLREGQTKITVTILLDVPAGAACPLKNYTIDWSDGKVDPVVYDPAKLELSDRKSVV